MITETLSLKKRNELRSLFKNKSRLSESHFAELIHSTLNKREDQFHGVWKAGRPYRQGDVVYHNGVLWEMQSSNEACAKEGEEEPGHSEDWTSLVKELEQRVDELQRQLDALRCEFDAYRTANEQRWMRTERYLTATTLGIAIAFVWLFLGSIRHLAGAG
ncbi:MAG: carbohydrate-binding protein [Cyanobacteria bacterium P01_A01_bin.135]